MSTEAGILTKKVPDPELADWLAQENGEVREILVDALLPQRTVTFGPDRTGRLRPAGIEEASSGSSRKDALGQLRQFLESFLDTPPVILEAAGALAVRATSRQVRRFVDHPLVKTLRPNRRLRRPA